MTKDREIMRWTKPKKKKPTDSSRLWQCTDCQRIVSVTYEALATVGQPYCPDCEDREMQLMDDTHIGGIPSPLRAIHDALYLVDGQYDADNPWTADTLDLIADIVSEHIPRPE